MPLIFHLSSLNPILGTRSHNGLRESDVKLQMLKSSPHCRRSNAFHRQCRYRSPGISSTKPHDFVTNLIVTKAVKTAWDEVLQVGEEEGFVDFEWDDEEDEGAPWEGAIVYRRNASITHMEYCTTLERLGLGKLSSELSKSRASAMGLRLIKAVKDNLEGTPVLVSVDVTRKKQKLRLDGIIRTVLTLSCNRCGGPATEGVFSNFSLLLTEEPIEEPEVLNLGVIYGEEKAKGSAIAFKEDDDEDEASIDMDDRLYFPLEEKEIDISKHIRDLVHLEITINAVCDSKCKGLCLKCGINLNTLVCKCSEQEVEDEGFGPLGELRKRMQHKV